MKPALSPKQEHSLVPVRPGLLERGDHGSFHGTVGRAVGGAAGGVLLAYLSTWVVGVPLLDAPALLLGSIMAGSLGAVAVRGRQWLKGLMGAGLGLGGAAAFLIAEPKPFAALLLGASMVPILAAGESTRRKIATGALGAAFGFGGYFVAHWALNWDLFGGLVPPPLAAAAAGAAAGLFVGLSSAPKHLAQPVDPVEVAFLDALSLKDGELHEVLARALAMHRSVRDDLTARSDPALLERLGARVGDLMMRILTIASQCRSIAADLDAAPAYELEERISALQRKADTTSDPGARETYRAAIATLDGQRQALDAITHGRERVVARLHAHVALLEKVRFSLVHLRSADAERFGGEMVPVTDALEELSRELDATSSAVGEVYGGAPDHLLAAGDTAIDNVVALPDGREEARVTDQRDRDGRADRDRGVQG